MSGAKHSRRLLVFALVYAAVTGVAPSVEAYRLTYREQLYELYHQHFTMYPERIAENVYWLEQALRSDFANPLNALARVETSREWEWYRYLFTMHINLKLVDLYLQWGAQYMKLEAYFFNAPWQQDNLESLDRAEELFRYALRYWEAADRWSRQATEFRFVHLEEIQKWEDEHHRIRIGELDYGRIIARHLDRVAEVRAAFEAMDESTY
jgi:hypothetical protein